MPDPITLGVTALALVGAADFGRAVWMRRRTRPTALASAAATGAIDPGTEPARARRGDEDKGRPGRSASLGTAAEAVKEHYLQPLTWTALKQLRTDLEAERATTQRLTAIAEQEKRVRAEREAELASLRAQLAGPRVKVLHAVITPPSYHVGSGPTVERDPVTGVVTTTSRAAAALFNARGVDSVWADPELASGRAHQIGGSVRTYNDKILVAFWQSTR